ncbi:MAG: NlpC/P60 family protein [Lachnospiraceae bacterium]
MYSNLRKGLFLVTFSGAVILLPMTAHAADTENGLPGVGIEEVLNDCYSSGKNIEVEEYLVPTKKGEYLDMAFADVDSFLYVRSEPTVQSEWVGKLYPDDAAKILGPVGEWTKVQSGTVTGYVYSEYITVGNHAEEKAQEIVEESRKKEPEKDPETAFEYAESKEEEEARLEKEAEEARKREEEERKKAEEEAREKGGSGQAVVDYACQFIGNPYVWGGTSLTNGADCSGFVQSVYKHFGINLPRTSTEMRNAGTGVSYNEAIPGDIICYDGHVGIYMGDGQIVNAINSAKGIGILPATYTNIITVRRIM